MKRILFISMVTLLLASCEGKKDGCIRRYIDEGYSYDEAKEMCDDAEDMSIQHE